MESGSFYRCLKRLTKTFNWSISEQNSIVGNGINQFKGHGEFNPVTAVAYYVTGNKFGTNKRDTLRAGRAIGLSNSFTGHVYDATQSSSNRGNTQVVRGKIRSALGV